MSDLSIIVPVYNSAAHLKRCILSCLEQESSNFTLEIILVNDGSTDESMQIMKEFAMLHSNITVLDQKNRGPGAARNAGLSKATGEYIWFVDSDDQLIKNKAAQLIKASRLHNVDLVAFKMESQNSKLGPLPTWNYPEGKSTTKEILLNRHYTVSMCSHLFNRNWLNSNKILVPELSRFEDNVFILKCLLAKGTIYSIDEICYQVFPRANSNSRSDDASIAYSMFESLEQLDQLRNNYKNEPEIYQALTNHFAGDIGLLFFKARKSKEIFKRLCVKMKGLPEYVNALKESTNFHHRSIAWLINYPNILRRLFLARHSNRID